MRCSWLVALGLVTLALSGCGGGGANPEPTRTDATPPADTLPNAGTTAVTAPARAGPALLATIRVGHHQGYDRIVFQFANALPGYRVSYVRPPFHQDGSGRPVNVHGRAFVFVRLEPASGYDLVNDKPVYRGPSRIAGAPHGTSIIREAVRTGDFESVLGWIVGLEKQAPFRVVGLKSPPRLVIDFRNR